MGGKVIFRDKLATSAAIAVLFIHNIAVAELQGFDPLNVFKIFGCLSMYNEQWTECIDGYYLYTNTTANSETDTTEVITAWVPDWGMADAKFTNDPVSRLWKRCGDGCLAWGPESGCESCVGLDTSHSYQSLSLNSVGYSTPFYTCHRCHNYNSLCETWSFSDGQLEWNTWGYGIKDSLCNECQADLGTSCAALCSDNECYKWSQGTYYDSTGGSGGFGSACVAWSMSDWSIWPGDACMDCTDGLGFGERGGCSVNWNSQTYYNGDWVDCLDTDYDDYVNNCTRCQSDLILKIDAESDIASCVSSCARNEYINFEFKSDDDSIYDLKTWNMWSSYDWYEWIGNEVSDGWKSCRSGYFLSLSKGKTLTGSWILKQNLEEAKEVVIFVTADEEEGDADGSYSNPYGHLFKALKAAEDLPAPYNYSSINIFLLAGDHFMTRNVLSYSYSFTNRDQYSLNKDIVIQPAFCGDTLGGHTFSPTDGDCIDSSESITIYYKMGNDFRFDIPKTLTLKKLIFDALDSVLDPKLLCLQHKSRCCFIEDKTLTPNPSNPEPTSECTVHSYQGEICLATFGNSLFQFQYSEELSNVDEIGTLIIESCTFQNFYHDFTSLIGLSKGHGHIEITDTTFDRFSN